MREMTTILLTDEDDEGRPVDARRRERPDRIPEARLWYAGAQGRARPSDRPAGRDPDDRCLVEREHELEIVRKTTEERNLGGPGFANIVVSPRSRRTSTTASRTVGPDTLSTVNDLTCG